jgi:hypothetical protein
MVATSKRHRSTAITNDGTAVGGDSTAMTGDNIDDAPAVDGEPGWPTLEVGVTSTEWSGYPLAAATVARAHRSHQAYLLVVFLCGLAAITVALVLTAVTEVPDKTPVQRCHDGLCPGTAGVVGYTGALEAAPVQVFKSSDGHFSVALFTSGLYRTPSLGTTNSGLVSLIYQNTTARGPNGAINLSGGEVQVGDLTGLSAGATAQQTVDSLVSKNAASATLAYPLPDALVGGTPGYGAVYTDNVNSSSGTQVTYRIVVMAAIRNGVAVAVWLIGPDDTSFPSLPFLDHPSFIDLDIALGGITDLMVNSIQWRSSTLGP